VARIQLEAPRERFDDFWAAPRLENSCQGGMSGKYGSRDEGPRLRLTDNRAFLPLRRTALMPRDRGVGTEFKVDEFSLPNPTNRFGRGSRNSSSGVMASRRSCRAMASGLFRTKRFPPSRLRTSAYSASVASSRPASLGQLAGRLREPTWVMVHSAPPQAITAGLYRFWDGATLQVGFPWLSGVTVSGAICALDPE
jgi:hypothetical protein